MLFTSILWEKAHLQPWLCMLWQHQTHLQPFYHELNIKICLELHCVILGRYSKPSTNSSNTAIWWGHIRIGSKVYVQHGRICSFHQHSLARFHSSGKKLFRTLYNCIIGVVFVTLNEGRKHFQPPLDELFQQKLCIFQFLHLC